MNILLSAYTCAPGRGSEPSYGWNWAVSLAKAGHQVHVLSRDVWREGVLRELAERPVNGVTFTFVPLPNAEARYARGPLGEQMAYLLWQRHAYRTARELVATGAFDVAHHVSWSTLPGGTLLDRLPIPLVLGPVGGGQVAPDELLPFFPTGRVQERLRTLVTRHVLPYSPLHRRLVRRSAVVLAINHETLALARRLGARDARLFVDAGLPASFYAEKVPPSQAEPPLRLLWVGRLLPRKGLNLALSALSRVRVPIQLTILGDGPLASELPRWIDQYGMSARVEWRGHVPWDEVRAAYRSHDLFFFTSLRDTCAAQLLEAMANGLPIVTLDMHGGRVLVPDDAGMRIPVTTREETQNRLARAVEHLAAHPTLRAAMRQAGLEAARKHEWSRRADYMIDLYRDVLGQRAALVPDAPAMDAAVPLGRPVA